MVNAAARRGLSVLRTGVFAAAIALPAIARADAPQLAEARIAVDEVRYDDAQRLLIAALEAGGNSPSAVRDIYKLLGASAVALGKTDDAEKYYRAWIALDPKAALDAGASPKLREPFDAAKSYVTANGPLDVAAEYVSDDQVRVRVTSDPLSLARTARVGDQRADIVDRGALITPVSRVGAQVQVIDRYGNTLVEVGARGAPPKPAGNPGALDPYPAPGRDRVDAPSKRQLGTGFYALAIPTGLLLATGVAFGAASIVYRSQVNIAIEDSGAHYYTDVADKQKRSTQFWKLSAIIGGAGLVLAIPTAIVYKRSRTTVIVPYVDANGGGAAIAGRF